MRKDFRFIYATIDGSKFVVHVTAPTLKQAIRRLQVEHTNYDHLVSIFKED